MNRYNILPWGAFTFNLCNIIFNYIYHTIQGIISIIMVAAAVCCGWL